LSILNKKTNVIVLLNGRIDSTARIYFYLKNNFCAIAVFIEFDQLAHKQELQELKNIAKFCMVEKKSKMNS
jgi:7-cyano-7-deazaguanine synthase in queuosine biosynthesis